MCALEWVVQARGERACVCTLLGGSSAGVVGERGGGAVGRQRERSNSTQAHPAPPPTTTTARSPTPKPRKMRPTTSMA